MEWEFSSDITCRRLDDDNKMELVGLDLLFLKRFKRLTGIILRSKLAAVSVLFLLGVSVLYEVIVSQVGLITSQYYVALGNKDVHGFWIQTVYALSLILLIALVKGVKDYVASAFSVQWRQIISGRLQELYFAGKNHYKINVLEPSIDNPDQRITQDVANFCLNLSNIIPTLLVAPFIIAYYTYESFTTTGYPGPVAIFCYFVVSTVVNKSLMSPIVDLVYKQERQEGRYRYKHVFVRVNSESIAFQDGEHIELKKTTDCLNQLALAQQKVYTFQLPLNVMVNVWDYFGSILSFLVLAVPVFNGTYDNMSTAELSGLISKNTFVSMYLINCFTRLVDLSTYITSVAGNTHRIGVLLEKMILNLEDNDGNVVVSSEKKDEDPYYKLETVSYDSPVDKTLLVSDLSILFTSGRNVYITGPSNSGKTSLFRILKALWRPTKGSVERQPYYSMFLSQTPLLSEGSLWAQILYPVEKDNLMFKISDEEYKKLMRLFKLADLDHLLVRAGGLDTPLEMTWFEALSPGEKQRLSFIRVLYHRPVIAFLDESTSALGDEIQERLYRECHNLGITTVTIGHKAGLSCLHHSTLYLKGGGDWEFVSENFKS